VANINSTPMQDIFNLAGNARNT